jgi:hypothetical protein
MRNWQGIENPQQAKSNLRVFKLLRQFKNWNQQWGKKMVIRVLFWHKKARREEAGIQIHSKYKVGEC